jgi:branched-chain amino acid transport system substrate-binding protein
MLSLRTLRLAAAAATLAVAGVAGAAETVKIAFIDVLSGPFALTGEGSLRQLKEVVAQINARSGAGDPKLEVVPFDNKGSPQESLTVLKTVTERARRARSRCAAPTTSSSGRCTSACGPSRTASA